MFDVAIVGMLCLLCFIVGFGLAAVLIVNPDYTPKYIKTRDEVNQMLLRLQRLLKRGLMPDEGEFFTMPPKNFNMLSDAVSLSAAIHYRLNEWDIPPTVRKNHKVSDVDKIMLAHLESDTGC
jgi:hypothetical protein